jgi:hypothetical protein
VGFSGRAERQAAGWVFEVMDERIPYLVETEQATSVICHCQIAEAQAIGSASRTGYAAMAEGPFGTAFNTIKLASS